MKNNTFITIQTILSFIVIFSATIVIFTSPFITTKIWAGNTIIWIFNYLFLLHTKN